MKVLLPFLAIGLASPAIGATVVASDVGLASPGQTVDFNEVALVTGTNVTSEFASFGVSFSPNVSYDEVVSARPNFSGAAVLSFFGTDFSVSFGSDVSEMAANITANFGSMTVEAFDDGALVESFVHAFPATPVATNADNFFGFTGIAFDRVDFTLVGTTTIAMDNLAFTAVVPVPGALPLLAGGLGALGLWHGRKRRRQG